MLKSLRNSGAVRLAQACAAVVLLLAAGCRKHGLQPVQAGSTPNDGVTEIAVSDQPVQTGVKRFGINLGGENFYDSGQTLRNLVWSNPGFEGETWQAILRCAGVTATSCIDGNQWTQWPDDFLKDATFEVISGAAAGTTGTVLGSSAAISNAKDTGVEIRFAALQRPVGLDDFIIVRKQIPGDAQAGWAVNTWGGGSVSTEFKDLPPRTAGKQAIRLTAPLESTGVSLNSYFDSLAGHSFVQMHGKYRLQFLAKSTEMGNGKLDVSLGRSLEGRPGEIFHKTVDLSRNWQEYSFEFETNEHGDTIGTASLGFTVKGAEVLLDDVSLTPAERTAGNPTMFRDEVVQALKELKPGILRYQDGGELGSSIDNLLLPPTGIQRAGWSERGKDQGAVPVPLPEFLELCKSVGAEPWFTMPAMTSPGEMKALVEYLSGPATKPYGAKRAARGQREPWTTVFPKIHLELGNEMWNGTTFAGASMSSAEIYGKRAKDVFLAARSVASYDAAKFDLVLGSFVLIPDWTRRELASSGGYDSTSVGGYLFSTLNDASSAEAAFGPMFAEPEMMDSRATGIMAQQAAVAKQFGAKLTIYEENTGTDKGSVMQEDVDRVVPSVGAGVALLDHMLLMVRDLGIKDQSVWALTGYSNSFQNTETQGNETTPLYGTVIDMGGATNRKRPQFLAEALVNGAILPTMMRTEVRGANPVWQQRKSANADGVQLDDAHEIQSFAFADGKKRSLVVVNLSRTSARPVRFSGVNAPRGAVSVKVLTSAQITDGNEKEERVKVKDGAFEAGKVFRAAPFSLTVLEWTAQ